MASSIYKTITSDKITSTKTLLNENVPVTGTLVSDTTYSGANIKNYAHETFQSVYDYPYLSSSANHLLDISFGYSKLSGLHTPSSSTSRKKVNVYGQMAQVLAGHESDGTIREFDTDGDLSNGTKMNCVYFLNLSRLLVKDEIKKGSFSLTLGTDTTYATPFATKVTIVDSTNKTKVNSPAGEYGLLFTGSDTGTPVGHVYYQAGVAVLTSSLFDNTDVMNSTGDTMEVLKTAGSIPELSDAIRHRVQNLTFNNVIELNSTIYFCDANHNEFNYSSNPTYLSGSEIIVKEGSRAQAPSAYITSVGLYSATNELLAVAKLSEPIKKDPTNSLTLRVRLDY